MNVLLKGAEVYTEEGLKRCDLSICNGRIQFDTAHRAFDKVEDLNGLVLVPGFVDVHVHLREPGFSYKETIKTGSRAAARGGFTAVCAMPNLKPAPSSMEALSQELELIHRDAAVHVYPYGTITKDQSGRGALSDMEELRDYVVGFSDDGKGVQEEETMRRAMERAAALGVPIVAHCEDERELKPGGCIHEGEYASLHNHVGINSASEWKQVQRDIALCEETGCQYHICHVSTKETVELVRQAKKRGVRVTCETGPHYLIYTDMDLQESGAWKMNPPIRSAEDREALLEGINDGTIDCIITDHAPHSQEEKSRGLDGSAFGITGLETVFQAVYSMLVKTGKMSFDRMIACMCINPRKIFGIPGAVTRAEHLREKHAEYYGGITEGALADLTALDLHKECIIDSSSFYSMGKSTLFDGARVQGEVRGTWIAGKKVYPFEA